MTDFPHPPKDLHDYLDVEGKTAADFVDSEMKRTDMAHRWRGDVWLRWSSKAEESRRSYSWLNLQALGHLTWAMSGAEVVPDLSVTAHGKTLVSAFAAFKQLRDQPKEPEPVTEHPLHNKYPTNGTSPINYTDSSGKSAEWLVNFEVGRQGIDPSLTVRLRWGEKAENWRDRYPWHAIQRNLLLRWSVQGPDKNPELSTIGYGPTLERAYANYMERAPKKEPEMKSAIDQYKAAQYPDTANGNNLLDYSDMNGLSGRAFVLSEMTSLRDSLYGADIRFDGDVNFLLEKQTWRDLQELGHVHWRVWQYADQEKKLCGYGLTQLAAIDDLEKQLEALKAEGAEGLPKRHDKLEGVDVAAKLGAVMPQAPLAPMSPKLAESLRNAEPQKFSAADLRKRAEHLRWQADKLEQAAKLLEEVG